MARIRFCLLSGIMAIALLVPGFSYAEEAQTLKVENVEENVETPIELVAQALDSCPEQQQVTLEPLDQQQVTLEQLQQLYGTKSVCGARCSHNPSNSYCTSVCGDAAGCRNGYCIYF